MVAAALGATIGCAMGSSTVQMLLRSACRPDPNVHFATFGNAARFTQSLARITREAAALGIYATIFSISETGLGDEFWARYRSFVSRNPRGFGYWIWKPWICLHILHALPEGDVLVYADAGCTLNPRRCARLRHYIASARAHPDGIVAFRLNGLTEKQWTKAATLEALGCVTPACHDRDQVLSGAFLIRNSPKTRDLVRRWLEIGSVDDGKYIIDSRDDECAEFKEHRHDQSTWSLLVKQHPGTVLYDNEIDNKGGPIWASRRRQ